MTLALNAHPGFRKPTQKEIEVLELAGRGQKIIDAEANMGLAYRSTSSRMARLRMVSGKEKLAALVYWGLTEMYIHYPKQGLPRIKQTYLDVVALIAEDKAHSQIAKELHLSVTGVAYRIRKARAEVGARTEAQLVAICWSEDWIA